MNISLILFRFLQFNSVYSSASFFRARKMEVFSRLRLCYQPRREGRPKLPRSSVSPCEQDGQLHRLRCGRIRYRRSTPSEGSMPRTRREGRHLRPQQLKHRNRKAPLSGGRWLQDDLPADQEDDKPQSFQQRLRI